MKPKYFSINPAKLFLALLIGVVWPMPARGTNIAAFIDSGQILSMSGAYGVALGDLDGDGDLDAYVIDHGYSGGDSVWLNDGHGKFTLGQRPFTGLDYDVKLGDLDGDGDLDAVLALSDDGMDTGPADKVLLNDGHGHFTDNGQSLGGYLDTLQVELGDVDRDGDLDVLLIRGNLQPCEIWLNDGAAHFSFGQRLEGSGANNAALGDLNGDGFLDAFIKVTPLGGPLVHPVWLNDGHGKLAQTAQTLDLKYSNFSSLVMGDLDGDGDLDVITGAGLTFTTYLNEVWLNDGTGRLTRHGTISDSGLRNMALGDVDNDGDLDVICLKSPYPNRPQIWLNDGRANLTDSGRTLPTDSDREVVLGDLDGDGDPDVFRIGGGAARVFFNFDLWHLSLASGWQLQTVDNSGVAGLFPSLALDGQKRPHIAYWEKGSQTFRYAFWDGVAWNIEDVEDAVRPNMSAEKERCSLAIDTHDRVRLAPVYASRRYSIQLTAGPGGSVGGYPVIIVPPGGDWTVTITPARGYHTKEVLVDGSPMGRLPSYTFSHVTANHTLEARFEPDGAVPGILSKPQSMAGALPASSTTNYNMVRDLVRTAGQWRGQTVAENTLFDPTMWYRISDVILERVTDAPVLAFNALDQPVIAYISANQVPYCAKLMPTWDAVTHTTITTWQARPLSAAAHKQRLDMALDPAGLVHAVVHEEITTASATLYHIYDNGSSFVSETISSSLATLPYDDPKIAVDRSGTVHVAYHRRAAAPTMGYLAYAYRDRAGWHPEERIADGLHAISLALDAYDQPNIAFVEDGGKCIKLATRQGGRWQVEPVVNGWGTYNLKDRPLCLKFDFSGSPYLAVYQDSSRDLQLLTREPNWQVRRVDAFSGPSNQTSLDLNLDTFHPSIAYWSRGEGLKYAAWTGQPDWNVQVVAPGTARGQEPCLKLDSPARHPHISFYNGDTKTLEYTHWDGARWLTSSVDTLGSAGRSSTLFLEPNPCIVYWESTLGQVRLAEQISGVWQVHRNPFTVGSNPDSGWPRAVAVPGFPADQLAASYYDAAGGALHLAFWNGSNWVDELIAAVTATGRVPHAIAYDNYLQYLFVAYADANGHALKLAKRTLTGSTWYVDSVTTLSETVTDLSLFLESGSYPALAYTLNNGELRLATKYEPRYGWVHEVVDANDGLRGGISQLGGERERFAYYFQGASGSELRLAFRTSTLHHALFSSLRPCTGSGGASPSKPRAAAMPQAGGRAYDLDVLRRLRDVFAATPGGQYYIDLYYKHALETGRLGALDPQLLNDSLTVLENLLPGFQAFAEGRGYQAVITQEMVDGVKNILDRLVAAGSTDLAKAIRDEYAKYHNLQDFVGLNFNQWGVKLGVAPPIASKNSLIQFLLGQQPDERGLDQNNDGLIDVADLLAIIGAKMP